MNGNSRLPRCPKPPHKRSFASAADARQRLWEIRAQDASGKMPVSFYECMECGYYHLTGNFRPHSRHELQKRSKRNRRK